MIPMTANKRSLIDRPQFAVHDTMDTFFIKDL